MQLRLASGLLFGMVWMIAVTIAAQATILQPWDGPTSGPPAQLGKQQIVFIAQDYRNGGITSRYRAFSAAAALLDWQVQAMDGRGDLQMTRVAFAKTIEQKPHAIVLGGISPTYMTDLVSYAQRQQIKLIG
ncbi:ABC-type sugar transport system substrate-binding protein [Chitinivorax tropicus]|uniref:ABC-type sugar transport system substrate-binding protein n=1 Tax=Chitinivorax tropicus TaxID=714531 RepID=A0A840MF34_9PROT|nr:hypothetical protein [Chitinivorax tropicus]MBB5017874.1 ABC-type sugar transport system substrate-binding protein [Chitinivorax tropicus]